MEEALQYMPSVSVWIGALVEGILDIDGACLATGTRLSRSYSRSMSTVEPPPPFPKSFTEWMALSRTHKWLIGRACITVSFEHGILKPACAMLFCVVFYQFFESTNIQDWLD